MLLHRWLWVPTELLLNRVLGENAGTGFARLQTFTKHEQLY